MRYSAVWIVVGALGCGGESGPPAKPGTERAACKPDRSCASGLVCLSDRCVRPPGADCQLVAESLTSLELGNYASPEERGPREVALKAQCEREHLTKDEGACITTAKTKDEVAWCAKPLIMPTRIGEVGGGSGGSGGVGSGSPSAPLPGICGTYVATLERFARCSKLPPETARQLRQSIAMLKQMYTQYSSAPQDSMLQSCQMANDATLQAMTSIGC